MTTCPTCGDSLVGGQCLRRTCTPDLTDATRALLLAGHLDAQHPETWTSGQWYPAAGPDGRQWQICRSAGRERNVGSRCLHLRQPVVLVIHHQSGEPTRSPGETHLRINLRTGEIATL